jgi:hypothetical protein
MGRECFEAEVSEWAGFAGLERGAITPDALRDVAHIPIKSLRETYQEVQFGIAAFGNDLGRIPSEDARQLSF